MQLTYRQQQIRLVNDRQCETRNIVTLHHAVDERVDRYDVILCQAETVKHQ